MALWLLSYSIDDKDVDRYSEWFEYTHIDEKLARDGYDWAAHYRGIGRDSQQYISLFGAKTSRVFFDPSPKQIKPNQTPLTKEMIGMRKQPTSVICSVEWSNTNYGAIKAGYLALDIFATTTDDQDVAAWCAQQYFPALHARPTTTNAHKLISSSGAPRHLCLVEMDSRPDATAEFDCLRKSDPLIEREQFVAELVTFRCGLS